MHLRQKRDATGALPGGNRRHRLAAHEHRSARRHAKAVREAQERRLAAAVGAKDAKHLSLGVRQQSCTCHATIPQRSGGTATPRRRLLAAGAS